MTTTTTITRDELLNAGWEKDSGCWVSPYDGEMLSFEQARAVENRQRNAGEDQPTTLEGAGYRAFGEVWVSPLTGDFLSTDEALAEADLATPDEDPYATDGERGRFANV
jgi:hypothetical protein